MRCVIAITGASGCMYGIRILQEIKEEKMLFINQLITTLLGLILLFKPRGENDLVILSIFWSVWAIMRESEEICEKVFNNLNNKIVSFFNFAESVVVIFFSIMLILNPTEYHLHLHIILLGIELILEVLFPLLNYIETKFKANKTH